jgi:hypothetical protein
MEILKLNMDIVREGLTDREEEVPKEVVEKFFICIKKAFANWVGKEVEEYNMALRKDRV